MNRISIICLGVKDMPASLRFYRERTAEGLLGWIQRLLPGFEWVLLASRL